MGMTSNLLFMLFSISFILYLSGSPSMYQAMVGSDYTHPSTSIIDTIVDAFVNPFMIGLSGAAIIAAISTGSFAVIYLIPAIVATALIGFFVLPIGFLVNPVIPFPVQVLISGFFSMMLLTVIINFIRGGDM